jgi:hypothetical protein
VSIASDDEPLGHVRTCSTPRDTERAMSQENVNAFKRGLAAYNRRDMDALMETLDPDGGMASGA